MRVDSRPSLVLSLDLVVRHSLDVDAGYFVEESAGSSVLWGPKVCSTVRWRDRVCHQLLPGRFCGS